MFVYPHVVNTVSDWSNIIINQDMTHTQQLCISNIVHLLNERKRSCEQV